VAQCRPDLELVAGLLRWMGRAPWFVPDEPGAAGPGRPVEGRRLMGTTPRRGFRQVSLTAAAPMTAGEVYALGPAGPLLLSPLVQWLAPAEGESQGGGTGDAAGRELRAGTRDGGEPPELFVLEMGGRREARLQAFPSGR